MEKVKFSCRKQIFFGFFPCKFPCFFSSFPLCHIFLLRIGRPCFASEPEQLQDTVQAVPVGERKHIRRRGDRQLGIYLAVDIVGFKAHRFPGLYGRFHSLRDLRLHAHLILITQQQGNLLFLHLEGHFRLDSPRYRHRRQLYLFINITFLIIGKPYSYSSLASCHFQLLWFGQPQASRAMEKVFPSLESAPT